MDAAVELLPGIVCTVRLVPDGDRRAVAGVLVDQVMVMVCESCASEGSDGKRTAYPSSEDLPLQR